MVCIELLSTNSSNLYITRWGKRCDALHFTDEETEAQKGKEMCPRPHGKVSGRAGVRSWVTWFPRLQASLLSCAR